MAKDKQLRKRGFSVLELLSNYIKTIIFWNGNLYLFMWIKRYAKSADSRPQKYWLCYLHYSMKTFMLKICLEYKRLMSKVSLIERKKNHLSLDLFRNSNEYTILYCKRKIKIFYRNLYNNKFTYSKLLFLATLNYSLYSYHQYT